MATLENVRLSYESNLPSLAGATEWLNSEPLTAADLRGHVVVVDFWTFSCINWIRTAPYLGAWDEKYRGHGLIVIGVHTPEFPFETDVDSIRAAIEERRIAYPVAVDIDYAIWNALRTDTGPSRSKRGSRPGRTGPCWRLRRPISATNVPSAYPPRTS